MDPNERVKEVMGKFEALPSMREITEVSEQASTARQYIKM
jgi:hypothetical protein